ncbi:MAG: hypothetical protein R6W96_02650 [Clostridia bacterium]
MKKFSLLILVVFMVLLIAACRVQVKVNPLASSTPTPTEQETPVPETESPVPPEPEYDFQAALEAWAADYADEVNNRVNDDGVIKTTREFEWVLFPEIRGGQIVGASRIWLTETYYTGPQAGTTKRWLGNEAYDADNPGLYITTDELKRLYPETVD